MATVNVHQAKTQLVPITRHPKGIKPPGAMRDRISIGDDFDLPLHGMFEGSLEPPGPEQP